MTEEEAKTKWCPQVRMSNDSSCDANHANNRFYLGGFDKDANCIASDCMMWVRDSGEWQIDGKQTPKSELDKYPTPEAANAIWVVFGHCGLINPTKNR